MAGRSAVARDPVAADTRRTYLAKRTAVDTLYLWLKFLHIAAVIAWLGGFFALTFLTARLARGGDGTALAAVGRQSGIYGQQVIPVTMLITLLAGLGMAFQVGFRLDALWIAWGWMGIIVTVLLGVLPIRRTGEALAAQARAAGPADPAVQALQRRLLFWNTLVLVLLLSIVWAMVVKPTF